MTNFYPLVSTKTQRSFHRQLADLRLQLPDPLLAVRCQHIPAEDRRAFSSSSVFQAVTCVACTSWCAAI